MSLQPFKVIVAGIKTIKKKYGLNTLIIQMDWRKQQKQKCAKNLGHH